MRRAGIEGPAHGGAINEGSGARKVLFHEGQEVILREKEHQHVHANRQEEKDLKTVQALCLLSLLYVLRASCQVPLRKGTWPSLRTVN